MEKEKKKFNLKIIIPIIVAIVVLIAVIIILSLTTKVFWNYEDYMDNAEFEMAYEKANTDEERNSVIKANAIAYVTLNVVNDSDVFDPYTTDLMNAWYDKDKNIVICLKDVVSSINYYLYYAYSESEKDYNFVCTFGTDTGEQIEDTDKLIDTDNIFLADSYTEGIESSEYSSTIQAIAIEAMKQKLPEKLSEIMDNENRITRETNVTNYIMINYVEIDKDIELLNAEN